MDATHPVRVILFWNSEHFRDAYDPYFTGAQIKTWTFTRIVTHNELVRKILKHRGMDPNPWRVQMTMRVPSFYEEYQMFNFTLYSMNNDDEMHYLWTIRPNISKEGIHILVEFEPIQAQPISEMVSNEPLMLCLDVEEDGDDNDNADEDYDVSNDISTPVNPLFSTAVNQW
ncbi:hypothetical protein M9H77_33871 [Catharanthus roseus]|uniref:Uncharacterized protein n=1 Tax=Catharanthus roseus TaxID=4058 RepID=A0ACB9ZKS4_CATRO|nr:hypothetical protein M9H77_33871 [Catharanthus roseus]